MFKFFSYVSLCFVGLSHICVASAPAFLSIINLSGKSIELNGENIKNKKIVTKHLSSLKGANVTSHADANFYMTINIKENSKNNLLYPKISLLTPGNLEWELTSNGTGFFSLIVGTKDSLLEFKSRPRKGFTKCPDRILQSSRNPSSYIRKLD